MCQRYRSSGRLQASMRLEVQAGVAGVSWKEPLQPSKRAWDGNTTPFTWHVMPLYPVLQATAPARCGYPASPTWWYALPVQLSDLSHEEIVYMLHKAGYRVEGSVTRLIQFGPAMTGAGTGPAHAHQCSSAGYLSGRAAPCSGKIFTGGLAYLCWKPRSCPVFHSRGRSIQRGYPEIGS